MDKNIDQNNPKLARSGSLLVDLASMEKGFFEVNPVRNSNGALNPSGIILKLNPAAAASPEGLWPGGSSGGVFLTGGRGIGRKSGTTSSIVRDSLNGVR